VNPLLQAALEYREAGLHPIPIQPRGKRPAIPSWKKYMDTTPTEDELKAWWGLMPDANVALIMGRGALAVDVDGPDGKAALATAGIDLSNAPCSRTGRPEGRHYFLAGTAPDRIGLFPHVDIRGVGYVVAPPSVHESGAVYAWEKPITGLLPDMPLALVAALRRPLPPTAGDSGPDWFSQALIGVAEGGRDSACTRLAGYLLGKGIPQDAVEIILQGWAERCTPAFPSDQVTKCVESIAKREGAPDGPPHPLAEAIDATMAEITTPPHQRRAPAATQLASVDVLLGGGLYPGEYVILGARPSVGKTALALGFSRQVAKKGTGVLFASAESTVIALTRRLLAQESKVDATNLKTGKLHDIEYHMLALAAARLRNLPMWLTTQIRTTDQLVEVVATYTLGVLGLIVVDYLQLFDTSIRLRDPRQRVEAVSKDLRRLSVDTEIPVLALSSLSRPYSYDRNWRPTLASLRESGELEHDADLVWLLHREEGKPETEMHIAKGRDGETGVVDLIYTGKHLTFEAKRP